MLWQKSWLETRFRVLFMVGLLLFALGSTYSRDVLSHAAAMKLITPMAMFWLVPAVMLAGDGIKTQPSFQAAKGLHGSVLFTLSLPVSRFRLLAVRAGLGFLEMAGIVIAGCCSVWLAFPAVRLDTTPGDLAEYVIAVLVCASGLYFFSVFLATFLDDIWRIYSTLIGIMVLWFLFVHLPSPLNVFRAMGEASPLITHTLPWAAMSLSVVLAVGFLFAAMRVAQAREF